MVQEAYGTHPPIREACDAGISDHAVSLEADIAEAMSKYKINANWSAASLALYTQAVIQGAFILAKAKNGPQLAADCLDHLRRMKKLFTRSKQEE
jgi:TetR/AcrR family transcriptional regulator, transcriptional repressor for nem operon